jgi:hypothetical protein
MGGIGGSLAGKFKQIAGALYDPGLQASAKVAALNIQAGTAPALVAGSSPAPISATLTANSRIFFSLRSLGATTAIGIPKRVGLTPGSPGSFTISSFTPGGTQVEAGDESVYDYLIVG